MSEKSKPSSESKKKQTAKKVVLSKKTNPKDDLSLDNAKEEIVANQTIEEISETITSKADGILTHDDLAKAKEIPATDSGVDLLKQPVQGEISQAEAIKAIIENRKLQKEINSLKKQLGQ